MSDTRPRTLGIIAGGGPLPSQVARSAQAADRSVFLVGLEGFADRALLTALPHKVKFIGEEISA